MSISNWLGLCKPTSAPRKNGLLHVGQTVAFDVSQDGNQVKITGESVEVYFLVKGIDLPPQVDATFAVWAVLALAMEKGFNVEINHPIDTLLKGSDRDKRGYAATIFGFEYNDEAQKPDFAKLLAKTDPLLDRLNCQRILIDTNANRWPSTYTHGLTLAASLYLLSDLFEGGTIAADRTHAQDMVTFPWGTNHIINAYFNGSDFTVHSIGDDVSRTEKVAAIAEHKIDPSLLSFCRQRESIPEN